MFIQELMCIIYHARRLLSESNAHAWHAKLIWQFDEHSHFQNICMNMHFQIAYMNVGYKDTKTKRMDTLCQTLILKM